MQFQHESAWYHTRRLDGQQAGAALTDATLGRRCPLVDGGSKPLETRNCTLATQDHCCQSACAVLVQAKRRRYRACRIP